MNVVTFLSQLFLKGLGYSGINTARSAISSVVGVLQNRDIGNHVLIRRFMKGIFHKKPSLPRYSVTWNVSTVLKYLSGLDNNQCSMRALSQKLAMLLLLSTGQRCQTLLCLDTRNIELNISHVKIRIGDLLKQSKPASHLGEIYIQSFDNRNLCVVSCLYSYINRTASYRKHSVLFLSSIKPYKPASRATLSNWIREVLGNSGIDLNCFKPHSTRSAATSAAALKVPVDTIIKTAGWTSDCTFRKHYKRPVTNDSSFSHAVYQNSLSENALPNSLYILYIASYPVDVYIGHSCWGCMDSKYSDNPDW